MYCLGSLSDETKPKSIILTLLQCDLKPYTYYIQDPNLLQKFIESLETKIPNENAVTQILASDEIVNLFSMLDNNRRFTGAEVRIKEIEPNIFTVAGIQGSTALDCLWPIVFTEAEFTLMQRCELATVFDTSDTSEDTNFITNLGARNDGGRIPADHHFMCTLVHMNRVAVLRTLLDRNVDVEQSINEPTPFQLACLLGREEIVAMFVYYNVTPHLPVVREHHSPTYHRHPPVYYAHKAEMDDDIIEMLIDYTFDKWSDFDVDFLLQLMLNASPNFDKAIEWLPKHAHTIASFFVSHSMIDEVWSRASSRLLHVRTDCFKRALEFLRKYRTACDALMRGFRSEHWVWYWHGYNVRDETHRKTFFENLYCLGDAVCEEADEPKPTLLHMMMDKVRQPLGVVTAACHSLGLPADEVEALILLLLSNNAAMDSYSYEYVLRFSVDHPESSLFDVCRHLDVSTFEGLGNFGGLPASSYYHRFVRGQRTITEVLRNPENLCDSDMAYYVRMSAHPTIRERVAVLAESVPEMSKALDGLPEFQTLVELARDAAREYVIEKYQVETASQFRAALKKLAFPEDLKKIIDYDIHTPLYNALFYS